MKAADVALIAGAVVGGALLLPKLLPAKDEGNEGRASPSFPSITFPAFNLGAPNISVGTAQAPAQSPFDFAGILDTFAKTFQAQQKATNGGGGDVGKIPLPDITRRIKEIVGGSTLDEATTFIKSNLRGNLGGPFKPATPFEWGKGPLMGVKPNPGLFQGANTLIDKRVSTISDASKMSLNWQFPISGLRNPIQIEEGGLFKRVGQVNIRSPFKWQLPYDLDLGFSPRNLLGKAEKFMDAPWGW